MGAQCSGVRILHSQILSLWATHHANLGGKVAHARMEPVNGPHQNHPTQIVAVNLQRPHEKALVRVTPFAKLIGKSVRAVLARTAH